MTYLLHRAALEGILPLASDPAGALRLPLGLDHLAELAKMPVYDATGVVLPIVRARSTDAGPPEQLGDIRPPAGGIILDIDAAQGFGAWAVAARLLDIPEAMREHFPATAAHLVEFEVWCELPGTTGIRYARAAAVPCTADGQYIQPDAESDVVLFGTLAEHPNDAYSRAMVDAARDLLAAIVWPACSVLSGLRAGSLRTEAGPALARTTARQLERASGMSWNTPGVITAPPIVASV